MPTKNLSAYAFSYGTVFTVGKLKRSKKQHISQQTSLLCCIIAPKRQKKQAKDQFLQNTSFINLKKK